jgi:hypothetical protein
MIQTEIEVSLAYFEILPINDPSKPSLSNLVLNSFRLLGVSLVIHKIGLSQI